MRFENGRHGEEDLLVKRIVSLPFLCACVLAICSTPLIVPEYVSARLLPHVGSLQQERGAEEIVFTRLSRGRRPARGAITAAYGKYRAADGVMVETCTALYRSAEKADAEMRSVITKAVSVIEKDTKKNHDGEATGQRAVLLTRDPRYRDPQAMIVWTDGKYLRSIQSSSKRHALALESQLFPKSKGQ